MKANTNIEGDTLVVPDVDACPCCGCYWVHTFENKQRHDLKQATPKAVQVFDASGQGDVALLEWTCNRCGYKHTPNERTVTG